ncbi:MAG: hypothetical protein ACTSWD_12825 [Candidatus Heimdallarchaeota archaeon]
MIPKKCPHCEKCYFPIQGEDESICPFCKKNAYEKLRGMFEDDVFNNIFGGFNK